ncbi:hypothetical protein AB4160_18440 [Shewanella sp. 10N.286.51.B8]|uniref:hypothetical protein n=1 Tax=Shewanella sp. 10N.286.51.B8 TaxID=3229708 RepID=UPI0035511147
MANEVRGLLYETITHFALVKAHQASGLPGTVYWNEKPDAMSVNPDFTIGIDKDNISHIILVTASGSSKESEKKSWRNLGETFEAKAQLPQVPIAINLLFKSEVKKGLSEAVDNLYDSTLHLERKSYFEPIKKWVEDNVVEAGITKAQRDDLLHLAIDSNKKLESSLISFAKELQVTLLKENAELKALWQLMSQDYQKMLKSEPVNARNTFVKRGLGKLLVIEEPVRKILYKNINKVGAIKDSIPEYCIELGLFNKTTAGVRLVDDEVNAVIRILGDNVCEKIIKKVPESMNTWIVPLRNLSRIATHVEFVKDNYLKITKSSSLKKMLLECYSDPAAMSGEASDEKLWLFEIMVSLLKAKSGKYQGYGISQMSIDFDVSESGQGSPLLRFLLPKFTQRQELPSDDIINKISEGLSCRFKFGVKEAEIAGLKGIVESWVIKENLEDRLIPYRNFEPILWLLEAELVSQGVEYDKKKSYIGWINEYADVGKRSATTPFVKVGNTLIHWKTVSDAGRGHKKKELSARARAFKYSFDQENGQFERREGVEQLVLIVDGTFDSKDLRILQISGWDRIIYPDEIETFVQELSKQ